MPVESPNASQSGQPISIMVPPNISAMAPTRLHIRVTPNNRLILNNIPPKIVQYLQTNPHATKEQIIGMLCQDPLFRATYVGFADRQKYISDYFCNAVNTGNANNVYIIQSNPRRRFDLNKTLVKHGLTALQMAAISGYSDLLRVLFHFGVSASIVNSKGHTALYMAMERYKNVETTMREGELSDVAMLIGYTQIRTLKTNGADTFMAADLERLKEDNNKHFVDELKNKYPEFQSLQL